MKTEHRFLQQYTVDWDWWCALYIFIRNMVSLWLVLDVLL